MSSEPQAPDVLTQLKKSMCDNQLRDTLRACPAALLAVALRDCCGLAASAEHHVYASMPPLLLDLVTDRADKVAIFLHFNMDSFEEMFRMPAPDVLHQRTREAVRCTALLRNAGFLTDVRFKRTRFIQETHRLSCTINTEAVLGC